ncbi:hypothetical protein HV234_17485 [Klebsiella grimontii]|uniref:Uncharacterized protein n=1 Tax=Klebsiella grimontii TaxID=2058152 RepID=A0ABD7AJX6_9ENTR|nr:hypothetical protein [Klebsiella grimontii]QLO53198.1 hypothetical protein HV234_17485 [Klebsiella grimontii]
MLTFTNNIKVSNVSLKSNEPKYEQVSWTGQSLQRLTGIQYYELEFTLNFNIKNRSEVQAFIGEYGQGKNFDFPLGHLSTYAGAQTGAVSCTSSRAAGNIEIPTSTQSLELGTLIQFTNHKKIYRIIARTNTSVTIFPALRSGIQSGEMMVYDGLVLNAQLDASNDFSIPITNVVQMKFTGREKF